MAEELKITTLDEVKTVLERLLSLMETEEPKVDEEEKEPEEESTEDESEEEETEKSVSFVAKTEFLSKSSDEERIAYSIAYPAMPHGWKDSQNDWIDSETIKNMSHDWMANSTRYDLHHKELNVSKSDAVVVESFIAPVDIDWPIGNNTFKRVNKGSWIVATKFSDQYWQKVKNHELNAYSIRGKAKRIPIKPAKS